MIVCRHKWEMCSRLDCAMHRTLGAALRHDRTELNGRQFALGPYGDNDLAVRFPPPKPIVAGKSG